MVNRTLGALALAGLVAVGLGWLPRVEAREPAQDEGYELWADCTELPDTFELLPAYLGNEVPGFVDLASDTVRGGQRWRAIQYTRDKDFGPTRARVGQWYGGMGAADWPSGTVDLERQYEAFRVTAWEVDGLRHAVPSDCTLVFYTDDQTIGVYNVWIRFSAPGMHVVRIYGRQVHDFPFVFPFDRQGTADPLGLEGRRVFVRGEVVGDVLDDEFVHSYEIHVGRE